MPHSSHRHRAPSASNNLSHHHHHQQQHANQHPASSIHSQPLQHHRASLDSFDLSIGFPHSVGYQQQQPSASTSSHHHHHHPYASYLQQHGHNHHHHHHHHHHNPPPFVHAHYPAQQQQQSQQQQPGSSGYATATNNAEQLYASSQHTGYPASTNLLDEQPAIVYAQSEPASEFTQSVVAVQPEPVPIVYALSEPPMPAGGGGNASLSQPAAQFGVVEHHFSRPLPYAGGWTLPPITQAARFTSDASNGLHPLLEPPAVEEFVAHWLTQHDFASQPPPTFDDPIGSSTNLNAMDAATDEKPILKSSATTKKHAAKRPPQQQHQQAVQNQNRQTAIYNEIVREAQLIEGDGSPTRDSSPDDTGSETRTTSGGGGGATRRERKRAQNRAAATRYRERKRRERAEVAGELAEEERRNRLLSSRVTSLASEIGYLRNLMSEIGIGASSSTSSDPSTSVKTDRMIVPMPQVSTA